jgi:hypothetical protein
MGLLVGLPVVFFREGLAGLEKVIKAEGKDEQKQ